MRHLILVALVSYFAGCGLAHECLRQLRHHYGVRPPGTTEVDHYRTRG